MKKRIAVVGSGAVGGYLGGHLARTGNDVTLIDPWPEHIEAIRRHGLQLSGMTDEESLHGQRSDYAPHRGAVDLQRKADRYRDRLLQILRHRMVDDDDPPVPLDRGVCRVGAEFDQRGDDRSRRRLGPHRGLRRREQLRRRSLRAWPCPPHDAARFQGQVDLCRRGARPHHAARRGAARHAGGDRRRGGDHKPVGRALVQAMRERHAQRRQRRDRHERQRARRARQNPPGRHSPCRRSDPRRPRAGLSARPDHRHRAHARCSPHRKAIRRRSPRSRRT